MTIQLDRSSDVEVVGKSVLIYVKGVAVYICKTDSGVLVDVYAKGHEFWETLGRLQVSDSLVKEFESDE